MKLMNLNIKSKQTMLATFVVLVGLVSMVFSHPVQALFSFGVGCLGVDVDCNHNGNHQGDHGKSMPGTKGDTKAQNPIGSQDQAEASGSTNGQNGNGQNDNGQNDNGQNANGGDANGGDAHGNNGNAHSEGSGPATGGSNNGNAANGDKGGNGGNANGVTGGSGSFDE
jgi:hypothetical protein